MKQPAEETLIGRAAGVQSLDRDAERLERKLEPPAELHVVDRHERQPRTARPSVEKQDELARLHAWFRDVARAASPAARQAVVLES